MTTLAGATVAELARRGTEQTRLILAEMSVGLTKAQALATPKIFQVRRSQGDGTTLKILAVVLKSFVDSVRVPHRPDPADIIEMADELMTTYSHDSIKDIILALKGARTSGKAFFQVLDQPTVFGIINSYFEAKATFLHNEHRDRLARGSSANAETLRALGDAGQQLLRRVADRIPANEPDREAKRRRLGLTKAREQRGLITPAQAEQQRAKFRALNVPKDRPDWKACPEAQKIIDHRHRQENQAIMDRYRAPTQDQ